jgi:hypothetical protein
VTFRESWKHFRQDFMIGWRNLPVTNRRCDMAVLNTEIYKDAFQSEVDIVITRPEDDRNHRTTLAFTSRIAALIWLEEVTKKIEDPYS